MKILIWGAGAIGGTIGAYLAEAGHNVVMVDREADHVARINEKGLTIIGPIDEFTVPVPAFTPEKLIGSYETILLCVKAQDTEAATQALATHLPSDGYVVSVQNGLNELVIADKIGRERTVGSFVNFGADYMEPGVIHFGGRGAVVLGELDGAMTERIQALHQAFLTFDPNAIVTHNIWGYLWGKLAYGSMLFATALTNESIADALADPAYRALYIRLGQEVMRVAAANDITPEAFNGFNPHAFVPGVEWNVSEESMDEMVAFNRRSAKTHSGIWRDLAVRKRRTEVDPQLGPIVTFGEAAGVPTPITARLIELIHDIEEGRRAQSTVNLDILMLEVEQGADMNKVSVIRGSDLPFNAVQGDGASGLQLARLYQNPDHALTFQLAQIAPGGISKRHQHSWEQINWVVRGTGQVDAGEEIVEIGPGDCVMIPGNVSHAIANKGDEPLLLVAVLGPGAP